MEKHILDLKYIFTLVFLYLTILLPKKLSITVKTIKRVEHRPIYSNNLHKFNIMTIRMTSLHVNFFRMEKTAKR